MFIRSYHKKNTSLFFNPTTLTFIFSLHILVLHPKIEQISSTPEPIIEALYQLMADTHQIFQHYNIPYNISWGTLLGAVRHQGIIPWDDDLDIDMPLEYKDKLVTLQPLFNQLGYELQEFWAFGYKLHYKAEIVPGMQAYPFLDIFFTKTKQQRTFYAYKYAQNSYHKRDRHPLYFTQDELHPFKEYVFGSFKVMGPQNPNPWLFTAFDKGCLNYVVYSSLAKHGNQRSKENPYIRSYLSPENRKPAQPTDKTYQRVTKELLEAFDAQLKGEKNLLKI